MGQLKNKEKIVLPLVAFAVILAVWEIGVRLMDTPVYILPSPSKIILAFIGDFKELMGHSVVTLGETFMGLAIATVCAIAIAIVMDAFEKVRTIIYPILVVSQTVPVIVLAPIFIIYLGFGMAPKILTVVLMCFFPIVVSFADGMAEVDTRLVGLVRSYGAKKAKVYTMVKMPAAAPSLFSGLKVAATYSVSGAVVGEWLSSNSGLGYYMLRVKNGYRLDKVFACVVVVVLLSLAMNGLVRLMQFIVMPYSREKSKN